jgi:prepilin-type N-terminal cleavage/methylation domain-containing protein
MIRANYPSSRRAGFTLVEVLVVVAIITVLVSLTAAAVFKIYGEGDKLVARKDISDLGIAIEAFKLKMNVDYIPSRFRLREDLFGYQIGMAAGDYLDQESWTYLKKLFPKLQTPTMPYNGTNPNSVWIDWNLNGTLDSPVDLEGHQCLVFFLGGVPRYNPNGATGFSTNPAYPGAAAFVSAAGVPGTAVMTDERIGPFFQFKSNQLVALPTPPLSNKISVANPTNGGGYFSMLDPWGVNPYVYFSGYKKNNGYNRYYAYYFGTAAGQLGLPWNSVSDNMTVIVEDRATLGISNPTAATPVYYPMWPYAAAGGVNINNPLPLYQNPLSYQIICSGPDKVFGQGTPMLVGANGIWTPQPPPGNSVWSPSNAGFLTTKGRDDYSNFHDRVLGSGD